MALERRADVGLASIRCLAALWCLLSTCVTLGTEGLLPCLTFNLDSSLPQVQFDAVCWSRKVVVDDREPFLWGFACLGAAGGVREGYTGSSVEVEQYSSDGVIFKFKGVGKIQDREGHCSGVGSLLR